MTSPTVPLVSLAQRIAQHEAELNALRQQYEARQNRLAELTSRKKELQTQLQQINAEIQSVDRGATASATEAAPARPTTAKPPAAQKGQKMALPRARSVGPKKWTLQRILTDLLAKSKKPLPARELAKQALDLGYPTKSQRLVDSVWTMLARMDNVENVPGQGYRLKKR
jgi:hypothetical protein